MSGYIGTQPVPQATQHRETFTATAGQTSFATAGYTPQFLDVFLNGIHLLNPDDYTATNGSDVVLTTGAALDDVLEVISYSPFEVADQTFTGDTSTDNLSVTGSFTSKGIDDNATSTAMTLDASGNLLVGKTSADLTTTGVQLNNGGFISASRPDVSGVFNRRTTDGEIVQFRKDGAPVGSIGNDGTILQVSGQGGVFVADSGTNLFGFASGENALRPAGDNTINLGKDNRRFKDLYLSGGVYLGGTGAANKLDDVEFGEWTPVWVSNGAYPTISYTQQLGHYTKVGNIVTAGFRIIISTVSGGSGTLRISGLPFQVKNTGANLFSGSVGWNGNSYNGNQIQGFVAASNNTFLYTHYVNSTGGTVDCPVSMLKNGAIIEASITYMSN